MNTTTETTQSTFNGLVFPVIRVRYAGPTNYRGSRWIATMRRDNERTYRVTLPYDHAEREGAANALGAAKACWEKARTDLGAWDDEHIAIPGDLSADTYSFTFVPAYFFNGR